MDKEHKDRLLQKALQGAAVETVGRFGSAVKEHLVSFSGKDRELGTETTRSLKSVSKVRLTLNTRRQISNSRLAFLRKLNLLQRIMLKRLFTVLKNARPEQTILPYKSIAQVAASAAQMISFLTLWK